MRSDITRMVDALALGDAAMVTAIEDLVDLDSFYSFWAVEAITAHWDGYAGNNNNFFVYGDPDTGKFTFMPWGADQLFGDAFGQNDPGLTRSELTHRLYMHAPTRERYLERYGEILDTVWDDIEILTEIDRMEALIRPAIPSDETQRFDEALTGLREAINGREELLRDGLNAAGPDDADAVADPLCFEKSGSLTATFSSVPFGTGGSGQATLDVTIDGQDITFDNVTAGAGPDDDRPGNSVIYFIGQTSTNQNAIAFVSMPNSRARPGAIDVTDTAIEAAILFFAPDSEEIEDVYFMSGAMTLDSGSSSPGSTWQGSLDLDLWGVPFL